jgi:uncharacterized membrane protein YGL010W
MFINKNKIPESYRLKINHVCIFFQMPGKELTAWLDEYSLSHQNPTNIIIHKICVPVIFASIFGLLWSLPIIPKNIRNTISIGHVGLFNPSLVLIPILAFYWNLSREMAIAMAILFFLAMVSLVQMEKNHVRIFRLSLIVFILAWIGQFIGHEIEGKKLWTLASAFRLMGIDY